MEKTLQLVFRNEEGGLFTLNIPDPREDLTEEDVTAVMDLVLAKGIFSERRRPGFRLEHGLPPAKQ